MKQGWIKLHRGLLDWEWFDEPNTFRLFIYLMLKANHKDVNYRGQLIKSGTLLTSREMLSKEIGLTERQIRTALNNLKTTNEVTITSSRKGTVIEIVKYKDYQQATNETTTDMSVKRPENDQKTTSNNNDKKEKNDKEEKKLSFEIFWSKYPSKIGRSKCLQKWCGLKQSEIETILSTIDGYVKHKPFATYTHPNPLTYLNQKRWEDVIEDKSSFIKGMTRSELIKHLSR